MCEKLDKSLRLFDVVKTESRGDAVANRWPGKEVRRSRDGRQVVLSSENACASFIRS